MLTNSLMIPDKDWLFRLPLTKDAIGVPVDSLKANTDYLWAISTVVPGLARLCFMYDGMAHRGTAFIEMAEGMNSITVNTGRLVDTTSGFDVTKTEVVYIGGFGDFSRATLLSNGSHCLVPLHIKSPRLHPLRGVFPGTGDPI